MRVRGLGGADAGEVLAALRAVLDGSGPPLRVGAEAADGADLDVPEDTAVVIATSGSTGRPKRVVLSRDALLASARATADRIGEGVWLLALPVDRVAGLQVLTRSIVAGTDPVVFEGRFDAAAFAAAAASMPRPARTSVVPAQLADLLDAGVGLARFDAVLVGGQRLDPALRARAERTGARIVRTYGSTETSGGCVYDGVPLDGVRLRIDRGEVLIAGATLATGYLDDAAGTDAVFSRDASGTRWYRTGDLGAIQSGVLAVTGRVDDVYTTGGINVSLARVEDAVRTVAGLERAVVVAVPDDRWGEASVVVVATDADPASLLAVARDAVATAVGSHARPTRVVAVDAVPHLASGKPDRLALRGLATTIPDGPDATPDQTQAPVQS